MLLHVKVMEVSRTKMRALGFDWAKITGGNLVTSTVSGMILPPTSPSLPAGAGGPFLLGGIFSVTAASVATRRKSSVDCTGMARMP